MGRRARSRAPAHPPRVVLRNAKAPDVWSEVVGRDVIVHVPGGWLRAPAQPTREAADAARRMQAAARGHRLGVTASHADLAAVIAGAFGTNADNLDTGTRLVAVAHVLRHWGLGVDELWR